MNTADYLETFITWAIAVIEYNFSTPSWAAIPVDAGTRRVVNDGMKILFDPTGILDTLRNAVFAEGSANA